LRKRSSKPFVSLSLQTTCKFFNDDPSLTSIKQIFPLSRDDLTHPTIPTSAPSFAEKATLISTISAFMIYFGLLTGTISTFFRPGPKAVYLTIPSIAALNV
jgi:hypothetical protein